MTLSLLLPIFLTIHLTALTVLVGTTLIDYLSYRTFWKNVSIDQQRSAGMLQLTAMFSRLAGIGAGLLIVTGIAMMAVTKGVFAEQLWFRIKFALIILLILNSSLVGRKQNLRLRKAFVQMPVTPSAETQQIRITLTRFHVVQLTILFTIIVLSVFRFN